MFEVRDASHQKAINCLRFLTFSSFLREQNLLVFQLSAFFIFSKNLKCKLIHFSNWLHLKFCEKKFSFHRIAKKYLVVYMKSFKFNSILYRFQLSCWKSLIKRYWQFNMLIEELIDAIWSCLKKIDGKTVTWQKFRNFLFLAAFIKDFHVLWSGSDFWFSTYTVFWSRKLNKCFDKEKAEFDVHRWSLSWIYILDSAFPHL